jgi:4-amino-4-deoxy-L-arabinose transferase-like glycosyltransferase
MTSTTWHGPAEPARIRAADVLLVLAITAAAILLRASAPVNTPRYAQFLQIRASVDHFNGGSYILPKIFAEGAPARKPQLYAWMLTGLARLSGAWNDFVFRLPSVLAAAGLAVLTYLLGLRWFSRSAALLAVGYWLSCLQMNKLIYLATTDMLLAFWIGFCIFCADRLTFHPARPGRWAWAVALWVGMIAAAITKGWGLVNLAVVGGLFALAGCFAEGFSHAPPAGEAGGFSAKLKAAAQLVLARAWRVMRQVHLGWGLLAMVGVSIPLWWAMLHVGGDAFRGTVYREVVQRITGEGEYAPHSCSVPAVVWLYYNTLPAAIAAGAALLLVHPKRWFAAASSTALPLWWIAVTVLAFAIPSGFRPDYLLPCYPAVALLAGWATVELARPERYAGRVGKHLRRIVQATGFALAGAIIVIPLCYFFAGLLPGELGEKLPGPERIAPATWIVLGILPVAGLAGLIVNILAVRRKRLLVTGWVIVLCSLGVLSLYSHLWSRSARTGDGEVMQQFAAKVAAEIGDEPFLTLSSEKMGTEVYLRRFGVPATGYGANRANPFGAPQVDWLVITDHGLLSVGAYRPTDQAGQYKVRLDGVKHRFEMVPESLGEVRVRSSQPIELENYGTIYLIRLRRPIAPPSDSLMTGYIPDPVR